MFNKLNKRPTQPTVYELLGKIEDIASRIPRLSLEQLDPDAAIRQLYNELIVLRGSMDRQLGTLIAAEPVDHLAIHLPAFEAIAQRMREELLELGTQLADNTRAEASLDRDIARLEEHLDRTRRSLSGDLAGMAKTSQEGLDQLNAQLGRVSRVVACTPESLTQIQGRLDQIGAQLDLISRDLARAPESLGQLEVRLDHLARELARPVEPAPRDDAMHLGLSNHALAIGRLQQTADRLVDHLSTGQASAINRKEQAPIERLHGMLEADSQRAQGAAIFAPPAGSSPFGEGEWRRISQQDDLAWKDGYRIRGFCSLGGELYTSVVCTVTPQDTGVWAWRDSDGWRQVMRISDYPEIADGEVNGLLTVGDEVLATVSANAGGGLWRIGAEGCEPLTPGVGFGAYCLTEHDGGVAFGCDPAQVYLYRDGECRRIAGAGEHGSWSPSDINGSTYTLLSHQGDLYAGIALREYGPTSALVWRLRDGNWELIGGEGVRGSWRHPHIAYLLHLGLYQGAPIATMTRPRTLPASASSVFALQDERWRPVAPDGTPWQMHLCHIYNHAIEWRDRLYVATGDIRDTTVGGRAALWELNPSANAWRCVGGGGAHPAWVATNERFGDSESLRMGGRWIYRIHVHDDRLVCGFAGHSSAAEVWMFTPHDHRAYRKPV